MTTTVKWLHFEVKKFYNFWNIRRKVCVKQTTDERCGLSGKQLTFPVLFPTERNQETEINSQQVMNDVQWSQQDYQLEMSGVSQGNRYQNIFLLDQLLQKLLDYAKIITQKEVRILTFDVHESHISQCWLPELTYRWHITQNLVKR